MKTKEELLAWYKPHSLESGYRVLEYLLNKYDLSEYTVLNKKEIANELGMGYATVSHAILDLQNMKILSVMKAHDLPGKRYKYKLNYTI